MDEFTPEFQAGNKVVLKADPSRGMGEVTATTAKSVLVRWPGSSMAECHDPNELNPAA